MKILTWSAKTSIVSGLLFLNLATNPRPWCPSSCSVDFVDPIEVRRPALVSLLRLSDRKMADADVDPLGPDTVVEPASSTSDSVVDVATGCLNGLCGDLRFEDHVGTSVLIPAICRSDFLERNMDVFLNTWLRRSPFCDQTEDRTSDLTFSNNSLKVRISLWYSKLGAWNRKSAHSGHTRPWCLRLSSR